jgi:hypothetical protein
MRRVLFLVFGFVLFLTLSACGSGSGSRIGGSDSSLGASGSSPGGNGSSIESIGGIGGDRSDSSSPGTPSQTADITVSPLSPSIAVGATMQFTATTKDPSGVAVHWASSAPNVATINDSGVAIGMAAGTTQITATAGEMTSPPVVLTSCDFRHL